MGHYVREDFHLIQSRLKKAAPVGTTLLAPNRSQVNYENTQRLKTCKTEYRTIEAKDTVIDTTKGVSILTDVKHEHSDPDAEDCAGLASHLHVAIGFPVCLRFNVNTSKGLTNGRCGFVAGVDPGPNADWIDVQFPELKSTHRIHRMTSTQYTYLVPFCN